MYQPGTHLDPAQFLTRWITHLCAPTFVFLAVYVMQLSVLRRAEKGESEGSITRFIVIRGLIIAALDPLWMVLVFKVPSGLIVLQVLYAIGMSFIAMAFLRRLPPLTIGAIGLVLVFAAEPLAALVPAAGPLHVVGTLLFTAGRLPPFVVGYPVVPWAGDHDDGVGHGRDRAEGSGGLPPAHRARGGRRAKGDVHGPVTPGPVANLPLRPGEAQHDG